MVYRDLLVHLDTTPASRARLDTALVIATAFGAKLTGLLAQRETLVQSMASRKGRPADVLGIAGLQQYFEQVTKDAGVESTWFAANETDDVRVRQNVVRNTRLFDLAILGQFDRRHASSLLPDDLVDSTIRRAGRPVLVVPHTGAFPVVGQRVIIAWNASREAARVVNDAMPFLTAAKSVSLLTMSYESRPQRPGFRHSREIRDHLVHHGVAARADHLAFDEKRIAMVERLLSHVADEGADLLVMGAYSDRMSGLLPRAAVTEGLLAQMTVPVLFSH